jgi:hypothetical protein
MANDSLRILWLPFLKFIRQWQKHCNAMFSFAGEFFAPTQLV